MEGASAKLDHQATTTSYVHDPLPGPRWIRVVVLQPASDLEDPLVGSFETVSLGKPLPSELVRSGHQYSVIRNGEEALTKDEKRAYDQQVKEFEERRPHLEHLVSARQLSYDALSYTWATESGDSSSLQSILLDGRRLGITQNLAEGLRRLRARADSKRLWIDAICINQSDLAERSEQVAMMFDIYRLSEKLIVWLGESAFPEEDHIVWQLTRSIRNAEEQLRHNRSKGQNITLGQIQIDALATFEKIDIGQARPPRFLKPNCRAITQHEYQSCPMDSTMRDSLPTWLAAGVHVLRPLRLIARLEMFLPLLERKYWKRRWILQENFSRMRYCDNKILYWGEYSSDWKAMYIALSAIETVIEFIQSRSAKRCNDAGLESFRMLAINARRILDPDTVAQRDLLWCLRHFSDFHCADPRDRLYSLLPLVPGHHLRADYTTTLETVCTRFAKSMVETGDMRVLYLAGDANHGPSTALPSWVPDLRDHYSESVNHFRPQMPDNLYCVNEDMSLTIQVHWIGNFFDGSVEKHSEQRSCSSWKGRIRRHCYVVDILVSYETRRAPAPKMNDILCAIDLPLRGNRCLWLRPMGSASSTYRLVVGGTFGAFDEPADACWSDISSFEESFWFATQAARLLSRVSVTII